MRVIGVDVGINGAMAVYDTVGPSDVCDLPTIGEGSSEELDGRVLLKQMLVWAPDLIILERAQAMPGNGASSMFKYGKGYGQIVAATQITKVPFERVSPVTWKKYFKLGKEKERSRHLAHQKFPELQERLRYKYHHQRAEALLIALWGAEQVKFPRKNNPTRSDNTSQIDLEDVLSGG